MNKNKICFLVSGNGGHLKFLHLTKQLFKLKHFDILVISDRECGAIEYAKSTKLKMKRIEYSTSQTNQLDEALSKFDPDLIITTWHKIIDNNIVKKYNNKLINLHYSLLPAFKGLIGIKPIQKAYSQQCRFIGATCHFVNEDVDSGLIISQAIVLTNQPIESAIQEVFKKCNFLLLSYVVQYFNLPSLGYTEDSTFQPQLNFDISYFDSNFWNKLKTL